MSTPGVGVRVGDHLSAISVEAGSGPGSVAAWSIHSLHRVELNRSQPNLGKRPGEGGSITASSGYVEVSAETQTHNTQTEHSCVFFFDRENTRRHRLKQPKFVLRCTQLMVGLPSVLVCAVSDTICVSVCLACLCVFRAVEAGRPGKYV
jgi:hypothetical protein